MPKQESKSQPKSQSQRQRFIDLAKKVEADETGDAFEKAFSILVPVKKPSEGKD